MENRVVITGLGIWSSIGTSLGEVTESLREGRSGIGLDPERRELGYISALTGIVKRPELKGALDRRKRLCLPQQGEYAYMATAEAMRNAGMDEAFLAANEVGIIYGNDSSAAPVIEGIDIIRAKRNTAMVGSGNIFQSMNSTVTMNLSVIFNLRGVNLTLSAACASGSHAIGMGYLMIRQGLQERIVCGGAQEVNLYSVGSFDGLGAFSKRESDPAAASRPFDKDRDGLVPSGGAATVILENYDSAVRRGAAILGEVAGYGFSSNGEHISVPNVDGPRRSLLRCLADAGMQPGEIPYVNAHATSTPLGDYNEALAIDEVFGANRPYVASTKSMTGHEMWMAGASEIVYSMLMMEHGFIAPNINFAQGDEATSTPLGDYNEALAIDEVFGANRPYVASTKSMTGHEMWMAGASEIVYSMLMMEHGFIAPNINFAQGDEATSKLNIPARKVDLAFDRFLSNSFGFGGTNSTLIIKKCK